MYSVKFEVPEENIVMFYNSARHPEYPRFVILTERSRFVILSVLVLSS